MSHISDRRLYLTEDDRVVEVGDPDARYLFAAEGAEISDEDLARLPDAEAVEESAEEFAAEAEASAEEPAEEPVEEPADAEAVQPKRRRRKKA